MFNTVVTFKNLAGVISCSAENINTNPKFIKCTYVIEDVISMSCVVTWRQALTWAKYNGKKKLGQEDYYIISLILDARNLIWRCMVRNF